MMKTIRLRDRKSIKSGDVLMFNYNGGSQPGALRSVSVDQVYPNGDFGGYEQLVAKGEYRRFNPSYLSNLVINDVPESISVATYNAVLELVVDKLEASYLLGSKGI